ncbi:glycoside hydrolase family 25 protein [Xylariales sp. PMI_506]|nr:glycoside hydrolase family 25 protein [Xylariales sp. PMI_506]
MNPKFLKLALVGFIGWIGSAQADVQGFDISNYEPTVDFTAAYNSGARFVIIKATEGTDYIDATFSQHWQGATAAGFVRGAYHYAHPETTSGAAQAKTFIGHGGGWTTDGKTLPGMLDLEGSCSNLTVSQMVTWISDFSETYHVVTGRYPMLYTSPSWWQTCTGDSTAFSQTNALVLAHWSTTVGALPGGWSAQTIWQNADTYAYGGDSDIFNGDEDALNNFAAG